MKDRVDMTVIGNSSRLAGSGRTSTRLPGMRGGILVAVGWLLLAGAALGSQADATALTPEQLRLVRSATFEVVVAKNEPATVIYERPLPLELVPFQERNDHYWSVGTAFAIAPGRYASAAHVLTAGIGSPFGAPALRDAAGRIYPIREIQQYSDAEDFVVFTIEGGPAVTPLSVSRDYVIDAPVFAVGNALGEGVIARDGLLNSTTPEAAEGRWKWLRFSAATSPGNSGGPLLDAQGRIVGIVIGKSPNENLNYALPIDRVLADDGKQARCEYRGTFALPMLHDPLVVDYRCDAPLPMTYAKFAGWLLTMTQNYYDKQSRRLLEQQAGELFPLGDSADVLATQYVSGNPALIVQGDDRAWISDEGTREQDGKLADGGKAWLVDVGLAASLFRVSDPTPEGARRTDEPRAVMDRLLKALSVSRFVGPQPIRITSLGAPQSSQRFTDSFGRAWRLDTWTLGYVDTTTGLASLATPDGCLGLVSTSNGRLGAVMRGNLRLMADYVQVTFEGTLPQWHAYLAAPGLRPAALAAVQLQREDGRRLRFEAARFALDVPSGLLALDDHSQLRLLTAYLQRDGKLTWDASGVELLQEDGDGKTFLRVQRQAQPGAAAGKDLLQRWQQMSARSGDFSGAPGHDASLKEFWVRTVAPPAASATAAPAALYEVTYDTARSKLPREIDQVRAQLPKIVSIRDP